MKCFFLKKSFSKFILVTTLFLTQQLSYAQGSITLSKDEEKISCDTSFVAGIDQGRLGSAYDNYRVMGIVLTVTLGLVGTTVTYCVAASDVNKNPQIPPEYKSQLECYKKGYIKGFRKQNVRGASIGTIVGVLILSSIVVPIFALAS